MLRAFCMFKFINLLFQFESAMMIDIIINLIFNGSMAKPH